MQPHDADRLRARLLAAIGLGVAAPMALMGCGGAKAGEQGEQTNAGDAREPPGDASPAADAAPPGEVDPLAQKAQRIFDAWEAGVPEHRRVMMRSASPPCSWRRSSGST